MTSSELSDVTVLELGTGISGAFAARILGDFGAAVTKVEPPGGDPLRDPSQPGGARGALFEYLNWNKGSVVLDLMNAGGHDELAKLAAAADVIVSSVDPPSARAANLTPGRLRTWSPRAVIVAVSNFGVDGPYCDLPASELTLQALGGVMSITGATTGEPLKRGLRQSLFYGGLNAAWSAIAGVYAARTSGEGVFIDLALRECVCAELVMNQSMYAFLGVLQSRPPATTDPFGGFPLACADGFVTIQASTAAPMSRLAELFADQSLTSQEFASKEGRAARAAQLRALIAPTLSAVKAREFFVGTARAGYVAGFVQAARDMLGCDQMAARGAFLSFPHLTGHDGRPLLFPSALGRLSGWEEKQPAHRAPALGCGGAARRGPAKPGKPNPAEAFPKLRVLDVSQVFAGPYLGGLLADFGMDVIKIESPRRLDQARTDYGGYFDNVTGADPWNRTSTFQVINRGKRAISLDLKSERGKAIFCDLVRHADIVIENFTPRVMPGLGLGYARLREINPRIIMLSNSGFGATGPWAAFKAQGTTLEATMGVCTYTGYAGGLPSKSGQSYPDFLATWTGLCALMAALAGRLRTGRGQWIDLGMYDLGISVMPEALLHLQVTGRECQRIGNREIDATVSGVVPCAGHEQWLAYSAAEPEHVERLRTVVGSGTIAGRPGSLTEAVRQWARGRAAADAVAELQRAGVPSARVLNARDLLFDPQLLHRGFYELIDIPGFGTRPIIGRPFRWEGGGIDVRVRGRAPRFAEHTEDILAGLLGHDRVTIAQDIESGAVVMQPIEPLPASPGEYSAMIAIGSVLAAGGDYQAVVKRAMRHMRAPALPRQPATSGASIAARQQPGGTR